MTDLPMTDPLRTGSSAVMQGKRGLIMGVANDHSIAWGVAQAAAAAGAELAFTYQGEAFGRRVTPLAKSLGADIVLSCDVGDDAQVAQTFEELGRHWDRLDFVLHAIAYSDKEELKGRYVDTSRGNFSRTLAISCYSFTAVAKYAAPMMSEGGSLLTLSFSGAERVMPNYNVMGVAKAALEASVRYLATDLGPNGVRVNALSAGPMRTLAGSAIGGARQVYRFTAAHAPLRHNPDLTEVGAAALFLLSDLSSGITGEVHHVDSGFSRVGMPHPSALPPAD